MVTTYDLIVRGGLILDGSGGPGFTGDVAVRSGRIAAIGAKVEGDADEVINATGCIVTPGFIDGHTHYDAQATWDDALEPSASHGVTTVVMGNCGVGFAPVKPSDKARLIGLMEDVEDIPGTALHEGIRWAWESFPQYLDALSRRALAMDVSAMIPHAPLRLYVMGERGAADEPATAEDLAAMAALVEEALLSGAVGFSTSRVQEHRTSAGVEIPGTFASEAEIMALAGAVRASGRGVVQVVPRGLVGGAIYPESANQLMREVEMFARVALSTRSPVIVSILQAHDERDAWREVMTTAEQVGDAGGRLYPMVEPRASGQLASWSGYHIFMRRETYLGLAHLPLEAQLAELRKPEVRAAILSDKDVPPTTDALMSNYHLTLRRTLPYQFIYDRDASFEPVRRTESIRSRAEAAGMDIEAFAYDAMMGADGRAQLFGLSNNYANGNYDDVAEMLMHPATLVGLSDAGAHVRIICDAANPTYMLTFWARDRVRGPTLPLEAVIRMNSADLADAFGFADRGRLEVGLRADINVIDFENLQLDLPYLTDDLPKGGRRMLQKAKGYVATLVNGVVTRRNDQDTGARPGRLVRDAGFHKLSSSSAKP